MDRTQSLRRCRRAPSDQPYGTGFSEVDSPSEYLHNQTQVAEDVFIFVQKFMEQNPQFQASPFYISAESYGGHYGPSYV